MVTMTDFNAISTIAYRDLLKFMRDRPRIISSFVFPFVFIAVLGTSFQASMGSLVGYNFALYTFTGVYAQTLFQSAAFGVISLIEDRDNDFSQEIFVSPISRYSIIFGKILGESLVAMAQGIGILAFGVIVAVSSGVSMSAAQLLGLVPTGIAGCLLGGAFGVIILANLPSRRAAEQVFPFIMLPQYFLAGVFNPIINMPPVVNFLSSISPLRYAVDLTRGIFYSGTADSAAQALASPTLNTNLVHAIFRTGTADTIRPVLASPMLNSTVMAAMFAAFLFAGTVLFVRAERNR
jgi:ABC-2 type transport system permease protein